MMKTFALVFLLTITIVNGYDRRSYDQSDDNEDSDENHLDRRDFEDEEPYFELRSTHETAGQGVVITLQNKAAMNTRLIVLYTDDSCTPFFLETSRVWVTGKKKVTLPANAKNVKVIVQKEVFLDQWRTVYNAPLHGHSDCIRITGVTFYSGVKKCT